MPKRFYRRGISPAIRFEFARPKIAVCLWNGRAAAARMMMPKASVNEYGPAALAVCEIRRAGKGCDVLTVSEPERPQACSHLQLGLGSPLSNPT